MVSLSFASFAFSSAPFKTCKKCFIFPDISVGKEHMLPGSTTYFVLEFALEKFSSTITHSLLRNSVFLE